MSHIFIIEELIKYLKLIVLNTEVSADKREFALELILTVERMRLSAPSLEQDPQSVVTKS